MGSFAQLASITASTKRSGGIVSGMEVGNVASIPTLKCLPLDPVSPDIELGIEGLAWYETLQTAVEGGLNIVEGDILVVGTKEYPIRAVADWNWPPDGADYLILYLEDQK